MRSRNLANLLVGILLACTAPCLAMPKADANCDGGVSAADVLAIIYERGGPPGECLETDEDEDGEVIDFDLTRTLQITSTGETDLVAQAADFECLTNWTKIRRFRIANKLGRLEEAIGVALASGNAPGLAFPVGTSNQERRHVWRRQLAGPEAGEAGDAGRLPRVFRRVGGRRPGLPPRRR